MRRPERPRGDDGAYAILYALLLLVCIGSAAVVVDLASLREDRRSSRLASDAAAVAGARSLDPLNGGNPEAACLESWSYVSTNLGVDVPPVTNCEAQFPDTTEPCPTIETVATATSDGVTVTVTWPVLQNSTLLTQPNTRPADASTTVQNIDEDVDGTNDDRCNRLAVTIEQTHEPFFAGVFGATDQTTTATSVARAMAVPGNPEAIAALNVLNETTCQAILTSGQGFIRINSVAGREGIISVESSGRQSGGGCPNNQPWVIDVGDTSGGGDGPYVRADGAAGPGTGTIFSYALNASPTGNPTEAYNRNLTPATLLQPTPTKLAERVGDQPVRDVYDCSGDCDDYPDSYVDLLKTRLQTGTPQPYEHHEAPYDTGVFGTLSNTPNVLVPGFSCTIGTQASVLVPVGNWYVDCPDNGPNAGLDVRGTLAFAGGTVVTRGGIDVQGCLSVNVPLPGPTATCPTVVSGDTSPQAVKGAILYMRSGSFEKGAQGAILMPRTFVYMNSGEIDFGAGSGTLFWTNPRQSDLLCADEECQASRFSKLALWNETTNEQSLGGQAELSLRGIMFVPEANFLYTGQPAQNQTNAQFWADTIEVTGQSGLTMAPDPTDSIATPSLAVTLIR